MHYYHCSPQPGLTVLSPQKRNHFEAREAVYLTSLLPMALMYGIRHFEYTYGYHWQDGKPGGMYYEEYFPDALRSLYAGQAASLYICQAGNYETTKKPNEYISFQPVKVLEEIRIPDLLAALLEQQRLGFLEIRYFHQLSEKMKAWIRRAEADTILQHNLLHSPGPFADFMRSHYPDSWVDALAASKQSE